MGEARVACVSLLGILSNYDGDGNENVTEQ